MEKLPEIKPEVLKDKEEERKGGLIGGLLSKLGGGAAAGEAGAAGAGGLGALGGAGAAAEGGVFAGLLATKAGILALVLAGTSVAGGIGFVGWKAFGPGADGAGGGMGDSALQVFAPKPPSAQGDGSADASKDGNSQSLSMVASANTTPAAAPAEPAKSEGTKVGEKDAVAGSAASASAAVGSAHANNTNVGGNAAASLLSGSGKKFGQLSGIAGAGAGGTSASFSGGSSGAGARTANVGSASQFAGAGNGTGRGLGMRKAMAGNAWGQGMGINGQSHGAPNLQAGGGQYFDGGAGGGRITGGGGAVALTGAGIKDGGGAKPASTAGASEGKPNPFQAPPEVGAGTNVTPWQNAVNLAMMMIGAAALLLFAVAKLMKGTPAPWVKALCWVLAGIAIVLGGLVAALGIKIAGGNMGQTFQGSMFIVSGAAIAAAGAACMYSMGSSDPKTETMASGNPTKLMYVCGATAIAATAAAYMGPKTSYPGSAFHKNDQGQVVDNKNNDTVDWSPF